MNEALNLSKHAMHLEAGKQQDNNDPYEPNINNIRLIGDTSTHDEEEIKR